MTEMGRKAERWGEKSSFAVTCSLLSQYIKEKGGLGDLGLDMAATRPAVEAAAAAAAAAVKGQPETYRPPTTMVLLPGVEVSNVAETKDDGLERNAARSMNLFPQGTGFGPSEDACEAASVRKQEKAQLTIFYGGKVLVFDSFPAEKALDLMQLASKSSPATQNFGFVPPSTAAGENPNNSTPGGSNFAPTCGNPTPAPQSLAQGQRPPQPSASFLPMARKASLHRFLEKRKDRIHAKAPYEANGAAVKSVEVSQPWLGLGSQALKPTMNS